MSKSGTKALLTVAVLAFLSVLAAGCSSLVDGDQPAADAAMTVGLTGGHEVGQTFVAQHGGLNGIEFSLRNTSEVDITVRARLRSGPDAKEDLASATIVLAPAATPAFYRFAFPAVPDSHNRYFYVALGVEGAGALQLEAAPGSTYLDGSIYYDGQPAEGQARFRASYDPGLALLEVLRAAFIALWTLGVALLAWALPGWALLVLCLPEVTWSRLRVVEKLALASGTGVALYPILMLWAATARIRLGNWLYWGPVVFAAVVLVWRMRKWRPGRQDVDAPRSRPRLRPAGLDSILLLAALLAVFLARLLVVRSLAAPSWGDSVQHAVMTQRIFEQGGLFSSWEPYAPYRSLSVQYGFAANAAVIMRWLGLSAAQATLLAGQLLSGLAVIALYPLALKLSRGNRWAGIATVIVAGLLSLTPGFYVNWGRYAQLAGQVVLPVALWLLWETAEHRSFSFGLVAAAGLCLAGMMLSYYRMPYYYAAFVLAWLLFWSVPNWRTDVRLWAREIGRLAAIAVGGGLLIAPWVGRVAGSSLAEGVERGMTKALPIAGVIADYRQWSQVTDYVPLALLVAGGLALLWAFLRRNSLIAVVALWVALMAALVAGRLINFPGANLLQSFAVMILLYIPLGLVLGWFSGEVVGWLVGRWGRAGQAGAGILLALLLVWGAAGQLRIVKRDFVLVTRPDMTAMAWIAQNTSPDAVFLVEGYRVYEGRSAVGSDAGWWAPLLAGRANTMPPQYALMNEVPSDAAYSRRVVDLVATFEESPPGSDKGLSALCQMGVTHVYVGQTQGATGMFVRRLYTPSDLLNDSRFSLVYHQDRVYIFALAPHACDVWAKVVM